MKIYDSNIIYENPLPQLKSRQSFFPSMFEMPDKTIGAIIVIGEAFESVDSDSYICFSKDGGKTFSAPKRIFDSIDENNRLSIYAKASVLDDGRIIAMGYSYFRDDPELPIGNPENGGVLDDFAFWAISEDGGNTFSNMKKIECSFGSHVEASAPITVLKDGSWITPITGFPDWNGKMHARICGRALRSFDEGETWNDDAISMNFETEDITCYEQRMCQLESGTIVSISWNENLKTGEHLPNHYTASFDNGKSWTAPCSCGVRGQASSVCAIGGERLLALHAVRRDTDHPGIYAYVIDFSERTWRVVDSSVVWEPLSPVTRDNKMAEIFSFLKFGQPGAIRLSNGDVMMFHWYMEQGQYKTAATRIVL